jgi:dipeptidyl aminopeptidase/acylaminoacyl peptidase
MRCRVAAALVLVLAACPSQTPPPANPALVPSQPAPPDVSADVAPAPPPAAAATPVGYTGLGAASVTAATVAKYAAPALDPAVSRRIQAMLDVRGATAGQFTRDGKRMLFNWKVTGVTQVWRQDGPQTFPVQLTGGEDTTTVSGIAPDDSFAVVAREIGGDENPGIYTMSLDGGALQAVQHVPGVQSLYSFISDDSKWIYFKANDVAADSYALYRYNVETKTREVLWTEPGLWHIADHEGDMLLVYKRRAADYVEVYTLDLATKKLAPIIGQGENEDYAAQFGTTTDTVLVRTNKTGDFHRLYAWKKGELTPISPEQKHDITAFGVDDARKRIYYQVNDGGFFTPFVLDAKTFKPIAAPKLPAAKNTSFAGASRDGRYAQFVQEGAKQVPQVVVYDWQTKKKTTWRSPSTPEVDVAAFANAELESYPARDGTPIPMFVRRPDGCDKAATPCPIVVSFHGGPEQQSTSVFNTTAQLYVDAGFIFVQPNVRGSSGYGKTWLHLDDGPKRLDVLTDIEDAATYLRAHFTKNGVAPKIGVTGGSYGGYATLMAMTYFAGAYDVGVSVVGISSLVTFLENTAPYRRVLRASEYGDLDKDRDALVKLSAVTYIDKLAAPLLVIQGLNDPRVPVGEAIQMHEAAVSRGIEGGLIVFPDEGHGMVKRPNQVLAIGHTIAFFEKHLKAK